MPQMGVVRAEGVSTAALLPTDKFVIQRFGANGLNQWSPFEALISEISTLFLGGATVLGIGTVTLAAGTATVALPAIAAGSVVMLTEANATPNALGYVITPGTGFVIHSGSGADTSSVSYVVLS
jgi:hypothetical protein